MQPILKTLKKTLFYLAIPFSVVFSHIAAAPITPGRNLRTHHSPAAVTTTHGGTSLDDWSIVHQVPDETSDKKEEKASESFIMVCKQKASDSTTTPKSLSSVMSLDPQSRSDVLAFLNTPDQLNVADISAFSRTLLHTFGQQMNEGLPKEALPKEVSFAIKDPDGNRYGFFGRHVNKTQQQSRFDQLTQKMCWGLHKMGAFPEHCNRVDSHVAAISPTKRYSIGIALSQRWDCNGRKKMVILVKPYVINDMQYLLIKPENAPCLSVQHGLEYISSPQDPNQRKERVMKNLPKTLGITMTKAEKKAYQDYGISYLIQRWPDKKEAIENELKTLHISPDDIIHRLGREHIVHVDSLTKRLSYIPRFLLPLGVPSVKAAPVVEAIQADQAPQTPAQKMLAVEVLEPYGATATADEVIAALHALNLKENSTKTLKPTELHWGQRLALPGSIILTMVVGLLLFMWKSPR